MKIKRFIIAMAVFLLVTLTIMYMYLNENPPLKLGIGLDLNTNEVLIDFTNISIFPIFVEDLIVKNENNTDIEGEKFMYRLNSNQIMVFSDELQSSISKDDLEFLEPLKTLYIQPDKNNIQNSIFIKDGTFNKINEVEVKIKVLGFMPLKILRKVDLVKNVDE